MAKNQNFIRNALKRIIPFRLRATLQNYIILSRDYGQFRSMRLWESVDACGEPIPWYAYPAVEYLKQLDLSDKVVFEFGSGNSTRFYASRCRQILSVEDDREWHDRVVATLPENARLLFRPNKPEYIGAIHEQPGVFDLIIIDGRSYRYECAVEALKKISPQGFIILDNSDWHEKTAQMLRDADLIEVDMAGFGPINGYTSTTSFFFRRSVSLKPAGERQPAYSIGGKRVCEADRRNGDQPLVG